MSARQARSPRKSMSGSGKPRAKAPGQGRAWHDPAKRRRRDWTGEREPGRMGAGGLVNEAGSPLHQEGAEEVPSENILPASV